MSQWGRFFLTHAENGFKKMSQKEPSLMTHLAQEISSECNIAEAKLRPTVERLTEAGLVEGIGTGRGRAYVLCAKAYKDPVQYVRQTDIDGIRYEELILKLARQKESVTRKDVMDLLHVSGPQAYRLLKRLENGKKLIRSGNTSAAHYTLAE